ncbi:hypothetical protein CUR178_03335 [Leishmania enriettii]|uniref:Uncharacterized protein n=1 Tax=Leishmania enriettii TaxID=5663 RepID=A0A836GUY2_LEIEN|nr:hypothetical protein CUR178_03335 [Leishmania enriettii]
MPALGGPTVAEQVAALPPLSQLLCIHPSESAIRKTKAPQRAPARPSSRCAGGGGFAKASSTQIRPACVPQQPSSQSVAAAARAPTSLAVTANVAAPVSSSAAHEESQPPTAPSTPLLARNAGGLREWRRVQRSLQLPLTYRAEDEIHLSLRLLRSLPLFAPLQDDDLLTLAETMQVIEVSGAGTVLLRKPPADDTGYVLSGGGAPASAAAVAPPNALPLSSPSLEMSRTPQLLDDEEEADASEQVWTMPAAHLFNYFKEQIRHGQPPSLPPVCTQGGVDSDVDNALTPITLSKATQVTVQRSSPQYVAEVVRELTADMNTAPLFSREKLTCGDDSGEDGHGAFVLILLRGHCRLKWPRERGLTEDATATSLWQSYELQVGDAMGYSLIWGALPPAAEYVTSEASTLLVVSPEGRTAEVAARLRRVLHRANEAVLREQRRFLAQALRARLFDPDDTALGKTHAASTCGNEESEGSRPQNTVTATGTETPSAVGDPEAPSIASLLETAARNLIPIRVPAQAVLFREGLTPVKECTIYFLVDGGLAVVRRVWSQDQQRLLSERAQLVRALTPATGICPPLAHLPATDCMEVTQLRPGDYCGDLAYLDEDPDHVASLDAEWTAAYWQSTLAQPFTSPHHDGSRCGAHSQLSDEVTRCASDGDHCSLYRRHRATVVAKQASSLYVLLPHAADKALVGSVLQRMRDRVHRDYVGYRETFAEYEKMYRWALYKERVMCDVSQKTRVNFR